MNVPKWIRKNDFTVALGLAAIVLTAAIVAVSEMSYLHSPGSLVLRIGLGLTAAPGLVYFGYDVAGAKRPSDVVRALGLWLLHHRH